MWIAKPLAFVLTVLAGVSSARAEDSVSMCAKDNAPSEGYQVEKIILPPDLRGKKVKIEISLEVDVEQDGCNGYFIGGEFKGKSTCQTAGERPHPAYEFDQTFGKGVHHTLVRCVPPQPRRRGVARSQSIVFNADDFQVVFFPKEYRLKAILWEPSRKLPITQRVERGDTKPQ